MNRALQMRLDRGLSRSEVVDSSGVTFKALRKVEEGQGSQAATLKTLGDFYGVSASSLLMPAIDEAAA